MGKLDSAFSVAGCMKMTLEMLIRKTRAILDCPDVSKRMVLIARLNWAIYRFIRDSGESKAVLDLLAQLDYDLDHYEPRMEYRGPCIAQFFGDEKLADVVESYITKLQPYLIEDKQ